MKNLLKKLSRDERGVSALEYAVLAAVIVGVVVVAVGTAGGDTGLAGAIKSAFTSITEQLPKKSG